MCPSTYVSGQVHSQRSGRGEAYLQSVDKSYCSGSDAAAEMGPSAHGHYSGHCGTHWKHQGRFWCLSYITKETFRGLSLVCKVSIKELVNVPAPRCEEEGFLPSPRLPGRCWVCVWLSVPPPCPSWAAPAPSAASSCWVKLGNLVFVQRLSHLVGRK